MDGKNLPKTIEFNRPAKYTAVKRLGAGACGETIVVHDENMDCDFVVKKYSPFFAERDAPEDFLELLKRFSHEARILFRLNHPNIVRVYNYFDYKEFNTAYILMEYIEGDNIVDFARSHPSMMDAIFEKIIDSFAHLEERNVLHRDIRPMNILVDKSGSPKLIDFGFGKKIEEAPKSAGKSITLNWWCETPPEFERSIYDFQTEVYFVGKLFEQIITEQEISGFKYIKIVRGMCERSRDKRYKTFSEVRNMVSTGQFEELSFSHAETKCYRDFTGALCHLISSIDSATKYERDTDKIISSLDMIYRSSMLEIYVPNPNKVAGAFLKGSFRYWSNRRIETEVVKEFLWMMRALPSDKQAIVLDNLLARLDSVERKQPTALDIDDDIPF